MVKYSTKTLIQLNRKEKKSTNNTVSTNFSLRRKA